MIPYNLLNKVVKHLKNPKEFFQIYLISKTTKMKKEITLNFLNNNQNMIL